MKKEPSAPLVRQFLHDADAGNIQLVMSWINVAETFYILAERTTATLAEGLLIRLALGVLLRSPIR